MGTQTLLDPEAPEDVIGEMEMEAGAHLSSVLFSRARLKMHSPQPG